MLIAIKLILCVVLIRIAYSDFRFRTISIYSLIMAILSGTMILFIENDLEQAVANILINISIISVQLVFVIVYFCARYRRFVNIFNHFLGVGDVLFFIVIALCFSPANLLMFMLLSEFLIIVFYFPLRKTKLIPLAGLMSVILCILFIFNMTTQQLQFYSDSILIDLFKL